MKLNYNFGRASLSKVDGGASTMGGREGIKKCMKWDKRGSFYRRGGGSPKEGGASP
jgi:hypothetical protein